MERSTSIVKVYSMTFGIDRGRFGTFFLSKAAGTTNYVHTSY